MKTMIQIFTIVGLLITGGVVSSNAQEKPKKEEKKAEKKEEKAEKKKEKAEKKEEKEMKK